MKIGCLQMNVIKKDKCANLEKIDLLINCPVDIVVLPELFSTGYYFPKKSDIIDLAEEIPNGFTTGRLIEIAQRKNCTIAGAILEKEKDQTFITAIMAGPSGFIGKHRKVHITEHESNLFCSGNNFEIFEINNCKVGLMICFEVWFPESARELMLKGAQIICHSLLTCRERTLDIARVRAIENKVYMLVANSISQEESDNEVIHFRGDSRVIDFNGNILTCAGKEEKLIVTEVDERLTEHKNLDDCQDIIKEVKKHSYL